MVVPLNRVLLTGASALLGCVAWRSLEARGYRVVRAVLAPTSTADQIVWDPLQPIRPHDVSGFEAVIHLSGETVVGQWTETQMAKIRESRVISAHHLARCNHLHGIARNPNLSRVVTLNQLIACRVRTQA